MSISDAVPPLRTYKLSDRFDASTGTVFLSGQQALARLPLDQLRADRKLGRRTAAFACGYPGSPLATVDGEFNRVAALALSDGLKFIHQPGQNEELAAAAIAGTQLAPTLDDCLYEGVLGFWYGKAPGLDRAKDSIRHGTMTGSHPLGGAVLLVGDDPSAKSSTVPSSSVAGLIDLHVPFLTPGSVGEVLELGRHAIEMSRSTGTWTALRIVNVVADGTEAVSLNLPYAYPVLTPGHVHTPEGGLMPPLCSEVEKDLLLTRLEMARTYCRLNKLNRVTLDPPSARLAIAAAGNCYPEVLEALHKLGLPTDRSISEAGIRLAKISMPYPMDMEFARTLADGVEEILVIEEKDPVAELFIKDALFPQAERPRVLGKRDENDRRLFSPAGLLDADALFAPLRSRLEVLMPDRLAPLHQKKHKKIEVSATRTPYFCSGCPHNTSTEVPEGSMVGMGIGCHGIIALMEPARVGNILALGAMGVEGSIWVGASHFLETNHFFQNLGDGTYTHSGQLGVQFAVASGVNVTFKILYNGTVAMTGGQDPTGLVGVPELATILLKQGVAEVLITTSDTSRFRRKRLPRGVKVWDRSRLMEAQEHLRAIPGVTVLIHEQYCAAELRRKRKRGIFPTPDERVVINERVCEGCGDCGAKSNCLSLQPLETEFGRKTMVDQTSCNFDYSCLKGDCPSFATVKQSRRTARRKSRASATAAADSAPPREAPTGLPEPIRAVSSDDVTVRMPGIGGTGVVTASYILGTAAMLSDKHVHGLDQTGLSQKAGPVVSDVRILSDDRAASNKASEGMVDLYLVFDLLTAAAAQPLSGNTADRTLVVASVTPTSTGAMIADVEKDYPGLEELKRSVNASSRASENHWVDAGAVTSGLLGSTASANVFMLGVAYQAGALPLTADAMETAIELNGVAVRQNIEAFRWGRAWVTDPEGVEGAAALGSSTSESKEAAPLPPELRQLYEPLAALTGLDDLLATLACDLVGYQSEALASGFLEFVGQAAEAEASLDDHGWELTEAVARSLHKLIAYKDEYEVARLLLAPEAAEAAEAAAGPGARIVWHLHPPLLRAIGVSRKLKMGRWARPLLLALRAGKGLRGTPLDVFGYTTLRRLERELPCEYREAMREVFASLSSANHPDAVEIARLPEMVRGYEHLKMRRAAEYRADLSRRLADFASNSMEAADMAAATVD